MWGGSLRLNLLRLLLYTSYNAGAGGEDLLARSLDRHPGLNATLLLFEALGASVAPSKEKLDELLSAGALVGARKAECVSSLQHTPTPPQPPTHAVHPLLGLPL